MELIEKIKNSKSMSGIIRMINGDDKLNDIVIDRTKYLNDASIHERLFNIKNDFFDNTVCSICNVSFLEWNVKYNKYKNTCSHKECKTKFLMINKDPESEKLRREKISETQKNKTEEEKQIILDKIKKTNIKKFGKDSYAKTQKFKNDMIDKYGYISAFELKETHDKSKLTLLKKYNCDHNSKIDEVKNNKKITYLNNYGVDNPTKSIVVKDKIIKTNNEKYGGNSPMNNDEVKEKARETYQSNYIDNELKMNELVSRREDTMFKKYGVNYWIQDSKNLDKLVKKTTYKKYLIHDKEYFLQGYEDCVLFDILLKKYDINDICIFNDDIEKYTGKIYYRVENKKHKYYPDFYIISENKIYEVKSEYTYNSDIIINTLKKDACINNGIDFEFIILSKKEYNKWKNNKNNKNI